MRLHLLDGTYELFRAHFGYPPRTSPDGMEVGAVTGLIVGTITGPGPMLNALGESAKDKMVAKPEPAEPASEA